MNRIKTITALFLTVLISAAGVLAQESASSTKPAVPPSKPASSEKPPASNPVSNLQDASANPEKRIKTMSKSKRSYASRPVQPKQQTAVVANPVADVQKSNSAAPLVSETGKAPPGAKDAVPAEPSAPPMKEGDSIPFMRKTSPNAQTESSSGLIWLKTLGAVLLVLGLLFAGTWAVKKTGLAGVTNVETDTAPDLKILSTVTPRNGQTLSVVRFGERVLLVGSTAQSFTLLSDTESFLPQDEEDRSSFEFQGKPVSVAEMLAREEEGFEQELARASSQLSPEKGGSST